MNHIQKRNVGARKFGLFLAVLGLIAQAPAEAATPDELVVKADRYRIPPGELSYTAAALDFEGGSKKREIRYRVSFSPPDKILIETRFPERSVGRNILMVANDMWLRTPDTQRATRVSVRQKLTGEIANGDLARTNFGGDYSATLVGEEKLNGATAIKLALKARSEGVTYSAINYWIDKKSSMPLKAEFLADDGRVLKTGVYSGLKSYLGNKVLTQVEFTDALDKTRRSRLVLSEFKKASFKPAKFNKENLEANGG